LDGAGREALAATLRWQSAACGGLGAPFYAALLERLALDAESGGPVTAVLADHAHATVEDAYALRLLGGMHRMVLTGRAPTLAAHSPSTGGDGDADRAATALLELLTDPPAEILDALRRPPQTNEVARSSALASGLLVVADRTGLPMRLREIGSSGGLNLRLDAYWFAQAGRGWGDAASPVRFVDLWDGGTPPFGAPLEVVERRGCDRDPIDVTTEDGSLTLLSYVWPEPAERFTRAHDAMTIARDRPVTIDRADADEWVPAQLAPVAGTTCVLMHSVVWQYLDDDSRAVVHDAVHAAGAAATPDAPVAWLRLEPSPDTYLPMELRLDLWDGSRDAPRSAFLASSGPHGGPLKWLGS
jgi:hypothetical protein